MSWDEDDDTASVLVPVTLTDAMIVSITAGSVTLAEQPGMSGWDPAATYAVGDRRYLLDTHRVYESLQANNTNRNPSEPANQFNADGTPSFWVDLGPTNRRAAFDGLITTQTSGTSPLVYTLRPGAANALALFGLDGDTISIVWRDAPGGNIVYTTGGDVPLESSMPADYYEYFFAPFKPQTEFTLTDIDPYGAAEVVITIKKTSGLAKLGMLAIGDNKPLGTPERNTRVSPRTYSYFEEDKYSGEVKIVRRPSARGMSIQIKVPLENADDVLQTVEDLLDVPVAVIGSKAMFHNKLSAFGLISGDMDYSTYPDRTLNLTVKGYS